MLATLEVRSENKKTTIKQKSFSLKEVEGFISDAYWSGRAEQAALGENATFGELTSALKANGLEDNVAQLQK